MNKSSFDILLLLLENPNATQRQLSKQSGFSLGKVNKELINLKEKEYLDHLGKITDKAKKEIQDKRPKNAIILAAGYGLRMIPLNLDTPKGLLLIKGETLVERIIKQLRKVGVEEIIVVVGHLKEAYAFLMDDEKITLVANKDYGSKNNLHSIFQALPYLGNSYIVPCDLRFEESPFSNYELYSWYGMSEKKTYKSKMRFNTKGEILQVRKDELGNMMVGVSYLLSEDLPWFTSKLKSFVEDSRYDHAFWEELLLEEDRALVWAKVLEESSVFEFTSLKDLRNWQEEDDDFGNPALKLIASVLNVKPSQIRDIKPMESGMTNRSFFFKCLGEEYIMRVPGEGTEKLIDRKNEMEVHRVLKEAGLSQELVYIDPVKGYKLTKKFSQVRVCDPSSKEDVTRCMELLREFHKRSLRVEHEFDVYAQLNYYEELWGGVPSTYSDYENTKEKIYLLKEFIEDHIKNKTLCHIDAVPDNFLFYKEIGSEKESIAMIDWEYAAMQDPHIDLAMFSIYANYKQHEIDELIIAYFQGECPENVRIKIYAYVALCGLLWSNWCEYKRLLGVDFGQYSLNQYRYAKVYYQKVVESEVYKMWSEKNREENQASTEVVDHGE